MADPSIDMEGYQDQGGTSKEAVANRTVKAYFSTLLKICQE